MADLIPFKAYRPSSNNVKAICCRPYDVLNAKEAREISKDNDISFYRVIKPEICFNALLKNIEVDSDDLQIMFQNNFIDHSYNTNIILKTNIQVFLYSQSPHFHNYYSWCSLDNIIDFA